VICSNVCSCGLVSNSLLVSGSGGQGDPWIIEAIFGGVYTSVTRPGSPVAGLTIYETDTKRQVTYDGTNWVIMSGQFPGVSLSTASGTQTVVTATATAISMLTEAYDIGGYHAGTAGVVTVPAGMAGDYIYSIGLRFSANAVGQRTVTTSIGSNGGVTNNPIITATTFPSEATANNGVAASGTLRLVAGATVTVNGYQTSGGNLTVGFAWMSLDMIRHLPSLV